MYKRSIAFICFLTVSFTSCARIRTVTVPGATIRANSVLLAPKAQDALRVSMLSVGAGMCQVVECPGTSATATPYVVDCGSKSPTGGMSKVQTSAYINGILDQYTSKPVIVLSHWDIDHHNWISEIIGKRIVSDIWLAGKAAKYIDTDPWIQQEVAAGATLHENLKAETHEAMAQCGLSSAQVPANPIVVTVNAGSTSNASSLVWAAQYGTAFVMLMGDATEATEASAEANLKKMNLNPPFSVITGSHHGSSNKSNSSEWANYSQPTAIIYSSGHLFWHPRCEATYRYRRHLQAATQHATVCGVNGDYEYQVIGQREYVTSVLGNVVVDAQSDGTYSVVCSNSAGCSVK